LANLLEYDYTKTIDVELFIKDINNALEDVKDHIDTKTSSNIFEKQISEISKKMEKNFEKNSLAKECARDKNEL